MNINKILCIWGTIIIFLCNVPLPVGATPNVTDCIEDEEKCNGEELRIDQENEDGMVLNSDNDASSSSLIMDIARLIFALLLVIGLIYIVLKLLGKKNKVGSSLRALENVGGISVGQNKSVQIIRIGNRLYMIGVGDNVELLQEITDEEAITELLQEEKPSEDLFGINFIQKLANKKHTEEKSNQHFGQLFEKELNNLKTNRSKLIQKHKEDSHE